MEYVSDLLRKAGYTVTLDPVDFTFEFPVEPRQLTPTAATYESIVLGGTGSGTVEGPVIPVDINLTPPRASTSGCEVSDFRAADWSGPNDIALIQRGTCTFGLKVQNAQDSGAEAVVIFNQGNPSTTPDDDREGLFFGDASFPISSRPSRRASRSPSWRRASRTGRRWRRTR